MPVRQVLRCYPAAKAAIPKLANVMHAIVKAAARVNNRVENSHLVRGSVRQVDKAVSRSGDRPRSDDQPEYSVACNPNSRFNLWWCEPYKFCIAKGSSVT
jgi:hypothetical protein